MFPGFKSKADREYKRKKLLEKYNQEIANDEAKREAYEEAIWAEDVDKNKISLGLSSSTKGKTSIADIYQAMADASNGFFQKKPDNSSPDSSSSTPPLPDSSSSVGDIYDQMSSPVASSSSSSSSQPSPLTQEAEKYRNAMKDLLQLHQNLISKKISPIAFNGSKIEDVYVGTDAKLYSRDTNNELSIGTYYYIVDWKKTFDILSEEIFVNRNLMSEFDDIGDEDDSMSDIDETLTNEAAMEVVKNMYIENDNLIMLGLSPISADGKVNENVFIGKEGKLYNKGSGKLSRISNNRIDWNATLDYVKAKDSQRGYDVANDE